MLTPEMGKRNMRDMNGTAAVKLGAEPHSVTAERRDEG
jgi:hypothetical protein